MPDVRNGKTARNEDGNTIASRILRFRRDAGLTQQALASFLGVSQRTVSRWERGVDRPSPGVLVRLNTMIGEGDPGRLPSVFEAVRDATVPLALVDQRGRVLAASRAYTAATGTAPTGMAASTDGKRLPLVLVVEDDEAVLKATRAVLKRWRFLSVGVTEGQAAVDLIETGEVTPDVAIIDVLLPGGMDGLETAAALRRSLPGLPVLIVTGESAPERLRQIAEAGFAVAPKPVDPQQVRMTLMTLLSASAESPEADEMA